jgi:MFS transporter, DHA1 family, multidrug resistance protein
MPGERFRTFGVVGGGFFFTITGLANPFFSLYAQELGASTFMIGLLVTLRALLPIFIAMPSGQLIDSIGPMRMLVFGTLCLLASMVLTFLATDLSLLLLSQLFLGTAIIVMASSFQVLVSAGERERRNAAIKQYSMWMSGGTMLGPLLGGLVVSQFPVPLEGYRAAFEVASVATGVFLILLLVASRFYVHPASEATKLTTRDILSVGGVMASYRSGLHLTRHRPVQFGLTATFIIMYIQSLYMSFLPIFMDSFGFSVMVISAALTLKGLAGMLSRYLLGPLSKRFSNEQILTGAGFIAAACVLLTPLAGQSTVSMLILVVVMGGALGVNLPVSIMIMVDAIGEGERGRLMGLRLLVNRFSQMLSPAMFGLLGQVFGLTAALYGGGTLLMATMFGFSAYAARTIAARKTIGAKDAP